MANDSSLEGCSMASMGKCYKFMDNEDSIPDNLIEVIFYSN